MEGRPERKVLAGIGSAEEVHHLREREAGAEYGEFGVSVLNTGEKED